MQSVELEVQDAKGQLYDNKRVEVSKKPVRGDGKAASLLSTMFASRGATPAGQSQLTGCRVSGRVDVRRVAGNLHVVPHAFSARGGMSMYRGMPLEDLLRYNSSHTIHKLRFGEAFPGQTSPLDDISKTHGPTPVQFQYYVQVVPTQYTYPMGSVVESNQFSVTEFSASSDPTSPFMVPPGLIIRWDMSPIMVTLVESHPTILQFFTGLCAIIGGVFTVCGLLDSLVHGGLAVISKID